MSAKFKKKQRFFLPFSFPKMIYPRILFKGILSSFEVGLKSMMDMRVDNFEPEIAPMDLVVHVASYTYNAEKFEKLENALFQNIRDYDVEYGDYLESHLKRTAEQLARVLNAKGFTDEDVIKIQRAFMLHDIGKIAQDINLWRLSSEKPSEDTKRQRSEHVHLARTVISQTIDELELDLSSPDDVKHLNLIYYFGMAHHERLNRKGPLGWPGDDLDMVLRIATIIDEIDGKIKVGKNLSMAQLFQAIKDPKHDGQFDLKLIDFCETVLVKNASPAQIISPLLIGLHFNPTLIILPPWKNLQF